MNKGNAIMREGKPAGGASRGQVFKVPESHAKCLDFIKKVIETSLRMSLMKYHYGA